MSGGLNLTGLPNTGDYNLGRGIAYIGTPDATTKKVDVDGWRDLGNCPAFSFTMETEELSHQSSREGTRTTDLRVPVSQELQLGFQLDELNFQNLALFFSGEAVAEPDTHPAVAGVADVSITTAAELGRWYDLYASDAQAGIRLMNIDSTKLSLSKDPGGTPVALDEGIDYKVDEEMGRIFFFSTAVKIADGDECDFTITADTGAEDYDEVRCLTLTSQTVSLKFIARNANGDKQAEYEIHQCRLSPEGEFTAIGEEFTTLGFTAVVENQITKDPNSGYMTIRRTNEA